MAEWNVADEMTLWEAEMMRHAVHERRRLTLVAAIMVVLGVLLFIGHTLDHAEGRSLVPLGLDDLIAGYPSEGVIALGAYLIWHRGRVLTAFSRWPGGGRG